MQRKKKVVIHSNFSKTKSGFGRHAKEILTYLHNTGKYELVEFASGLNWSNSQLSKMPWKTYGTLPDTQEEWNVIFGNLNENDRHIRHREVTYGAWHIDKLIRDEKPDVYFGIEDIWAFNGYFDKKWWNKITSAIHTTLDSLPILPEAIEAADKVNNYFVWAKFAEEALHQLGKTHVKTVHGAIDSSKFFKLTAEQKAKIRTNNNIPQNAFVIGFVFRNQTRKTVVKLLQGFKKFLDKNPSSNAYLLLHTNWSEGWNIPERIKEFGINPNRVLCTYICKNCKNYEVKPFQLSPQDYSSQKINVDAGQNKPCKHCGKENSLVTVNTTDGVSEEQLNEIYNIMDVYCHPFTSGGQELPIQEAKLTELITLVTNYSCGTEYCTQESGGFPLDWTEYREPGTEFIKATTSEDSIAEKLQKVYRMTQEKRDELGLIARKFVLNTCDINIVGKIYEEFIDNAPFCTWDFDFSKEKKNPDYIPEDVESDSVWLKNLYKNMLLSHVKDDDKGLLYWLEELKKNKQTRESIYQFFKDVALKDNNERNQVTIASLFENDSCKKILLVLKESIGDCFIVTSIFKSLLEQYPDHHLYISTDPKHECIFKGNPYVYKVIPYHPNMENELYMTGAGQKSGLVDVFLLPAAGAQKYLNYLSNSNIALELT